MNAHFEPSPTPLTDDEDAGILAWLRWWHWVLLIVIIFLGLIYYPLWRFDQRFRQLQIGDTHERMTELLGDAGEPSFSVQGTAPAINETSYTYSVYWRTYEILISDLSGRVVSKNRMRTGNSNPPPPNPGQLAPALQKKAGPRR